MSGNIPRALAYGAYDAAQVLADRYIRSGSNQSSKPMKIATVSVPAAKQMKLNGTMQGLWSGVSHIQLTADGMMVHQRVYVGEIISAITTGNVYLYDSSQAYSSYIGAAATTGNAASMAPVFPLIAGGPLNTNSTPYSTLWKQPYFFPNNLLATQLAASFEYWRPHQFNVNYVPTCPTSTGGNLAMAWTPSTIEEFNVVTGTTYMGSPNSFQNMSQCPYFTSTPVWQAATLANIQPMLHGSAQGGNGWLKCKAVESSSSNVDSNKAPMISAGCIIFNVLDNVASLTSSISLGHIFADYVYCYKGQHSFYNQAAAYYTLTRPVSWHIQQLYDWIAQERRILKATPAECKNRERVQASLDISDDELEVLASLVKRKESTDLKDWLAVRPKHRTDEEMGLKEECIGPGDHRCCATACDGTQLVETPGAPLRPQSRGSNPPAIPVVGAGRR